MVFPRSGVMPAEEESHGGYLPTSRRAPGTLTPHGLFVTGFCDSADEFHILDGKLQTLGPLL